MGKPNIIPPEELAKESLRIEKVIRQVADFNPEVFDFKRLADLLGWVSIRAFLDDPGRLSRAAWSTQLIDSKKAHNYGIATNLFEFGKHLIRLGGYAWVDSPDQRHTKVILEAMKTGKSKDNHPSSFEYTATERIKNGRTTHSKQLVCSYDTGDNPGKMTILVRGVTLPGESHEENRLFCKFEPTVGKTITGYGALLRTFHGTPRYEMVSRINTWTITHESFLLLTAMLV